MRLLKTIALYARVSSQKQADENTIESQLAAIRKRIMDDQLSINSELEFCDNGYSGAELVRPALEKLRDRIAASTIDRLYIHSPDRLSRKMAHQAILIEEFRKYECEIVFLNQERSADTPEANLLIQMQGMIAEYEREKIMERTRRGRKHSATLGHVSVFSGAPYGYRYIRKSEGNGVASWEIEPTQSEHVREIFHWVGNEHCTLAEVARRLLARSICTATGKSKWDRATIRGILINPAYHGHAIYGKERSVPRKPGRRAKRGDPAVPRRPKVTTATEPSEQIVIPVPAIIDEGLFQRARVHMNENRKRQRERQAGGKYLLSGLVLCGDCGFACCARRMGGGKYLYYQCIASGQPRRHSTVVCNNPSVKGADLESLVWLDLCSLLRNPDRLRCELERRQGEPNITSEQLKALEKTVSDLRSRLDRLIDAYESGIIDRDEFEHRIGPLRERHTRESSTLESLRGTVSNDRDIESASSGLLSLASSISERLDQADWSLKRDLMKLLINRVELHHEEIRLVYKVPPNPFALSPANRGFLQHWLSRQRLAASVSWRYTRDS